MNEEEVHRIIKDELDKYTVFHPYGGNTAMTRRIVEKIHAYIIEEKEYVESKRLQRVIAYRILSIASEFGIVYLITHSIEFSVLITPICLIVHSLLHWLVDKLLR